MYITVWYEHSSGNSDLIYAADQRQVLNLKDVFRIASNEFLERYPRPSEASISPPNQRNSSPLAIGKNEREQTVSLNQGKSIYELVTVRQTGNEFSIKHSDRNFLERYFRELYWDLGGLKMGVISDSILVSLKYY